MAKGNPSAVLRSCKCGCGRTVKRLANHYYGHSCVPSSVRQAAARASRRAFTLNRRARLFGELLKRVDASVVENGGKLSRGELAGAFDYAYQRGWDSGYHASECKWVTRRRKAKAA